MKFLARCAYDGADYYGFARSQGKTTIQKTIEETLIRIFHNFLPCHEGIVGGSRTDKGVHALDQCFTFHAPDHLESQYLLNLLNHHLPASIRVHSVSQVGGDFHLPSLIESKNYIYLISHSPNLSPFLSRYLYSNVHQYPASDWNQFFALMQGKHDFRAFAKESYRYNSTICNLKEIYAAYLPEKELTLLFFTADRFLYNMIRRIIGFAEMLLKKKARQASSFDELVEKYHCWCSHRAPAQGLYLYKTHLKSEHK